MQVESVTSKKQVNNHYVHNWVGPSIGYRIKIDKKLKSFHKIKTFRVEVWNHVLCIKLQTSKNKKLSRYNWMLENKNKCNKNLNYLNTCEI